MRSVVSLLAAALFTSSAIGALTVTTSVSGGPFIVGNAGTVTVTVEISGTAPDNEWDFFYLEHILPYSGDVSSFTWVESSLSIFGSTVPLAVETSTTFINAGSYVGFTPAAVDFAVQSFVTTSFIETGSPRALYSFVFEVPDTLTVGTYTIDVLVAGGENGVGLGEDVYTNVSAVSGSFEVVVPEPGTLLLLGAGCGAIFLRRRRAHR